jgi:uncharacterized membrane protein YeaQ/YmgE (transglycosylase-associated protein family)
MYFLSWIVVGLITGWLTGELLTGGGYGPIMDSVMSGAGALAGGSIVGLTGSSAYRGPFFTGLAAMFGAASLIGLAAYADSKGGMHNIAKAVTCRQRF